MVKFIQLTGDLIDNDFKKVGGCHVFAVFCKVFLHTVQKAEYLLFVSPKETQALGRLYFWVDQTYSLLINNSLLIN